MQTGTRVRFFEPLAVGALAGVASVARLQLSNDQALRELLWAEDGLFPLCVVKENVGTCLVDPFAGYLLFLPRLIAGFVALFPLDTWALVANSVAATLAGAAAALSYWIVRRSGSAVPTAVLLGLLPVIAPLVGLEAINAVGSVYLLLLYVLTLGLAFPAPGRGPLIWLSVGAFITALTIPSAAVLLIALLVQPIRGVMRLREAAVIGASLIAGLIGQFTVALTAPDRRNLGFVPSGLEGWINELPNALLSYWPGVSFGATTVFGQFTTTPFAWTGWIIAVAVLVLGLGLLIRGTPHGVGIGLLLVTGFAYGAVPTLTGYANNRYFVLPALLWFAAAILAIDGRLKSRRSLTMSVVLTASIVIWSPAFPASPWRAGPSPAWSTQVAAVDAICSGGDPGAVLALQFTPDWPTELTELSAPTNATVLCFNLQ
jgi:hypothetical protein